MTNAFFVPLIYIYNNRWSREKLKLEFLIRVLILCHVFRFILLIFQFKYEIGVKFYPIFTVLTLGSPPLIEIFFTFKCCGFFLAKYNLLLFFKYQTRLFIGSPPLLPKLTTTTSISSPPWSQTSNSTLATTLFSHGSGMPLSLSLSLCG